MVPGELCGGRYGSRTGGRTAGQGARLKGRCGASLARRRESHGQARPRPLAALPASFASKRWWWASWEPRRVVLQTAGNITKKPGHAPSASVGSLMGGEPAHPNDSQLFPESSLDRRSARARQTWRHLAACPAILKALAHDASVAAGAFGQEVGFVLAFEPGFARKVLARTICQFEDKKVGVPFPSLQSRERQQRELSLCARCGWPRNTSGKIAVPFSLRA